jgi:hypothetical protein
LANGPEGSQEVQQIRSSDGAVAIEVGGAIVGNNRFKDA